MKKIDSRIKSLTEAIFNILIGFSINFVANIIILPIFGLPFSFKVYGFIGALYTFISLARSYMIRRLFVKGFYETLFNNKGGKNDRRKKK